MAVCEPVPIRCRNFALPVTALHIWSFSQFQFHIFSNTIFHGFFSHKSTHLAVVIGHAEQGDGAVGVAAVTDRGHVSVPHDRRGGQRLVRGVRVQNGVALPGRRGQLGAQSQVLLDLLILGLMQVELGVLQVALDLQRKQTGSVRWLNTEYVDSLTENVQEAQRLSASWEDDSTERRNGCETVFQIISQCAEQMNRHSQYWIS